MVITREEGRELLRQGFAATRQHRAITRHPLSREPGLHHVGVTKAMEHIVGNRRPEDTAAQNVVLLANPLREQVGEPLPVRKPKVGRKGKARLRAIAERSVVVGKRARIRSFSSSKTA